MALKPIVLPSRVGRGPSKVFRPDRKPIAPTRLSAMATGPIQGPPTLLFSRRAPKAQWLVPPVEVPFYWFDIVMVRKKLITAAPPDIFLCDGRRFKVIAQQQKLLGAGYTRWLVCEEHKLIPKP